MHDNQGEHATYVAEGFSVGNQGILIQHCSSMLELIIIEEIVNW